MSETNGQGPKVVKVATPDEGTVELLGAPPPSSVAKHEIEAQIEIAHKFPRDTKKFLKDAVAMVTLTEEIAGSCIYSMSRGGENIAGKSVRLAEICLSAWGNCHAGARPIEVGARDVTSQGVCWDVERNVRITMETKRRITTRNGSRYGDDMIATTQMAAASIALRNAILRVIPSAFTDEVYRAAKACAVGEGEGASSRRAKVFQRLAKMGATVERILAVLHRVAIEEVTIDDVEILIGFGTAIKDGEKTVDEVFPALATQPTAPAPEPAQATDSPKPAAAVKPEAPSESPAVEGRREPAAETSAPSTAARGEKPKQESLAGVAARKPPGRQPPQNVDSLISGPPTKAEPRELTYEEQEAANRAAAAPPDDEMPPWGRK